MVDLYAVTVCVNYSHLFKHCIPNKRFFKRWVIVTHKDDKHTIKLCKENDLEYIFSEKIYQRTFWKSGAINEALDKIGYDKDWYIHIDSDVLLPDNFMDMFQKSEFNEEIEIIGRRKLKQTGIEKPYSHPISKPFKALNLFCMGRINVDEEEDFEHFVSQDYFDRPDLIVQRFKGYGYFQMWHGPSLYRVYPDLHHMYPSLSKNAGHDDWIFSKMFYQLIDLPVYCIHLSPENENWDGFQNYEL